MNDHINNAISGAVQASLAVLVGHPFDSIKANMQVGQPVKFNKLYRGAINPLLSRLLTRPIQYPLVEALLKKVDSVPMTYAIGGASGAIGATLNIPLQVTKVSMQVGGYKNSYSFIRHTMKHNGISGFYRGAMANILKDSFFSASFIGNYYNLRSWLGCDTYLKVFASGAIAHSATWIAFMPIDFIQTSIQTSTKSINIRNVIVHNMRKNGPMVFWRGIIPACVSTIPMSGIAMVGYEWTRNQLK